MDPMMRGYLLMTQQNARNQISRAGWPNTIRGREVHEVIGFSDYLAPMKSQHWPSLGDATKFAEELLPQNLARMERKAWQAILADLDPGARLILDDDKNSRRVRVLIDRSRFDGVDGPQISLHPSCWMAIQIQCRRNIVHIQGYARSIDVAILPIDCAFMYWIGSTYTSYVERPPEVQVQVYAGNLHEYTDGRDSDGGFETTRFPAS